MSTGMTRSVVCRCVCAFVAAVVLASPSAHSANGATVQATVQATVWVDGDSGDDTHTGATPVDALRTLERGIAVCRAVKCSSLLLRGELRVNATVSFGPGLEELVVVPGQVPRPLR